MIIHPKYVALDSSHWSKLIAAASDPDVVVRRDANRFADALLENGCCILFTLHHLQELMAHRNRRRLTECLDFVRRVPLLAWIGLNSDQWNLGGITDVLAAEAQAAYRSGGDALAVRNAVKPELIRTGSGETIIVDDPLFEEFLAEWADSHADHARTITGISPMRFISGNTKVGTLLSGKFRSPADVKRGLLSIQKTVVEELELRGDKRIQDANQRAGEFVDRVVELGQDLPDSPRELVYRVSELHGIDDDEIHHNMTVDDLGDLAVFRSQLRTIAPRTGIPFDTLKKGIKQDQLPSRIIMQELAKYSQDLSERKGSDLNDGYLATLAAYADILFVDKRTAENFRRAFKRNSDLKKIVGKVRKAANWPEILDEVREL